MNNNMQRDNIIIIIIIIIFIIIIIIIIIIMNYYYCYCHKDCTDIIKPAVQSHTFTVSSTFILSFVLFPTIGRMYIFKGKKKVSRRLKILHHHYSPRLFDRSY